MQKEQGMMKGKFEDTGVCSIRGGVGILGGVNFSDVVLMRWT